MDGVDAPTCTALRSWIEADLARLPAPDDPGSATWRLRSWKLTHALADVAEAIRRCRRLCAAQQLLGPRVRDDAGMARRLLDAGRAAEAYAIIQHAEPNRAKRVFCRRRVTGSPSAQISPAFE